MSIPVILDTDIGMDADDVWALAFLLRCPELDLKLVVSDCGDTTYAAACAARVLTTAQRSDVPIGIGIPLNTTPRTHLPWLGDFNLQDYPGTVHPDGVGALIDTIMGSSTPVTLISIGPVPNIAAALAREPRIAERARFVGMHGSLRKGYLGAPKPHIEYNVKQYPQAAQSVFSASWDMTITPLDTCGDVVLQGGDYARMTDSADPLAACVVGAQESWNEALAAELFKTLDLRTQTTPLYDTVAVYLAFTTELLHMERLPLSISDDGRTQIEEHGKPVNCATRWLDQTAFTTLLVDRLTQAG